VVVWGCGQRTRKPVEGEKVLTHVVAGGESLETIADDYYGDPERAQEIREFNLLEADDLSEGEVVRVYMTPDDMEALGRRKRARVPYNAGLDMARKGAYLDAVAEFIRAVELDPGFAEAAYNLGVTYQKLDSHDKAVEQFEYAISLRSGNSRYYYAVGNSYFHLERYDRAVRAFEQALSADPNHLKAQYSLAASLEKTGNNARAKREWQRYLDMDSDSEWAQRARARLAELEQ
jgi:tetratricopeptide (TPR) repeat protein